MAKKTTWVVKAFRRIGPPTVTVKDGITTTSPNNGWVEIKRFNDFVKADAWLCDYINKGGYCYWDYTIVKK